MWSVRVLPFWTWSIMAYMRHCTLLRDHHHETSSLGLDGYQKYVLLYIGLESNELMRMSDSQLLSRMPTAIAQFQQDGEAHYMILTRRSFLTTMHCRSSLEISLFISACDPSERLVRGDWGSRNPQRGNPAGYSRTSPARVS